MSGGMTWALSSRWNGRRHNDGAALVDEIRELGFNAIELGYDFRRDLADGVLRRVKEGAIRVCSVHSFCPVPMSVPRGHPEIWTLANTDPFIRRKAVENLRLTMEFAAEMGADRMVVHGGYVPMRPITNRLVRLAERGREGGGWWNWSCRRLERRRERLAPATLERLREGLLALKADAERLGVRIALENLPNLECVPSEAEAPDLLKSIDSPWIGLWYDLGHGQIRENLGYVNAYKMLERLEPWMFGLHVHDVAPPATDHVPPGQGMIHFPRYRDLIRAHPEWPRVIEPMRDAPAEDMRRGLQALRDAWGD